MNIRFLCPPFDEQESIVSWLRNATSNFDAAIDHINCELSLLHEYRSRLISDVITGKLDVREVAAQLPQEAEEAELLDVEEDMLTEGHEELVEDIDPMPEEAEL